MGQDGPTTKATPKATVKAKAKRGPSAYNKRYKLEYARQKKKHPRTDFAGLAKRTHRALRR